MNLINFLLFRVWEALVRHAQKLERDNASLRGQNKTLTSATAKLWHELAEQNKRIAQLDSELRWWESQHYAN